MPCAKPKPNPNPAALKDLYEALWWVTRSAEMSGPYGTTLYFISDDIMERARLAVFDAEAKPKKKGKK